MLRAVNKEVGAVAKTLGAMLSPFKPRAQNGSSSSVEANP